MAVLKLDCDCWVSKRLLDDWVRFVAIPVCQAHGFPILTIQLAPSEHKGFHFLVTLEGDPTSEVANALQFLLGDDRKRYSSNRARIRAGLKEWNRLWEPPHQKWQTIYEREGGE